MAGLAAVDELIGRLGIVEVLGRGIGPIKQRDRGLSGGQLLVGMATAQLVGQDCPDGMDRVRADVGNALLVEAPVAPSRTAARLGPRRSTWTPATSRSTGPPSKASVELCGLRCGRVHLAVGRGPNCRWLRT